MMPSETFYAYFPLFTKKPEPSARVFFPLMMNMGKITSEIHHFAISARKSLIFNNNFTNVLLYEEMFQ